MVLTQLGRIDQQLLAVINTMRMELLTEFFTAITALGSVVVVGVLIAGLWIYRQRETAVLSALGVGIAGITTKSLKILIGRGRPEDVQNLMMYGADSYAFPSGHTTLAFAMAIALAHTRDRAVERYYLYTLAVLVGISRIYLGAHYVSDVIAGAAIGIVASLVVVRNSDRIVAPVEDYL
jgi:undecaprenyl-diphosphatase